MTKSTSDYVRDICHGYNERQHEIALGDKGRPRRASVLAEYMRLNSAIDTALLAVKEEPLRDQIRRSLVESIGYEALYQPLCGRNQFYFLKRVVAAEIARLLHLTE